VLQALDLQPGSTQQDLVYDELVDTLQILVDLIQHDIVRWANSTGGFHVVAVESTVPLASLDSLAASSVKMHPCNPKETRELLTPKNRNLTGQQKTGGTNK
jgi:hypothetical protein